MARAAWLVAVFIIGSLSAATASGQREAPPAPSAEPSPSGSEEPTPAAPEDESDALRPRAPAAQPAPPPAPPQPPPQPAPAQRYEGQIEGGGDPDAIPADEIGQGEDAVRATEPHGSRFPAFSIRVDPFNWLLDGRLGFELEVAAWKFISVELVPVFVADTKPPTFNFAGRDDPISQHSNGLGPIAGTSIGAGFWLSGKPFEGYVLRAILSNYGFTYKASDAQGVFDRVSHTERHLIALFGSHTTFGIFTISGGIGLGIELNQQERCFANAGTAAMMVSSHGCPDSGELHILTDRQGDRVADLNGSLFPIYLVGRLSLGITID